MTVPQTNDYISRGLMEISNSHNVRIMVLKHPLYGCLQEIKSRIESNSINALSLSCVREALFNLDAEKELLSSDRFLDATLTILEEVIYYLNVCLKVKCLENSRTALLFRLIPWNAQIPRNFEDDKKTIEKKYRLSSVANEYLISWFLVHENNPYPSLKERRKIAERVGLDEMQVRNWFANMRKRYWKRDEMKKKLLNKMLGNAGSIKSSK